MITTFIPLDIIAVLVFILVLLGLLYWVSMSVRPSIPSKEKRKIYASGENITPERMNVPYEGFFKVLIRIFSFEKVSRWHSGDLSRYLTWIFTGMVFLIIILTLVWGV